MINHDLVFQGVYIKEEICKPLKVEFKCNKIYSVSIDIKRVLYNRNF